ncbi:hypothetical protein BDV24DRAFT_121014 [Aspergillus arachidicola]|uniref:Uncharacterized protein n=1 Tax=Aspergillus arachidicola TaxID=656916 RepID=A0A5N6YSF0_9EURO|nr:hypothetical protein BDV24DRAFT_121014 [Aspergillus arachidicola]
MKRRVPLLLYSVSITLEIQASLGGREQTLKKVLGMIERAVGVILKITRFPWSTDARRLGKRKIYCLNLNTQLSVC